MKIDSLTLHHISMPLVAPFETSFGRETERECILITLQSEGLTGYGECVASREPGYNYETTGTAWHILRDFIAPLILGNDIVDASDFQRHCGTHPRASPRQGRVEMAIWDMLGKREGRSLKEMFGGTREEGRGGSLGWDSGISRSVGANRRVLSGGRLSARQDQDQAGARGRGDVRHPKEISRPAPAGGREFCIYLGIRGSAQAAR
jgi:o-succinylbenzoate synthase